ncbi:hypothetical protein FJY69_06920, partial [candidate division WOR-3 bacterium]|nr:hypothetical protein [candidate division WOR-3 bacterium]
MPGRRLVMTWCGRPTHQLPASVFGLVAWCLVVSVASAQFPETTVTLPDSFGGLLSPRAIAVNTANNTV